MSTIECVVFRHVQCPSPSLKFLIFEKVLPHEQGLLRGRFLPRPLFRSWFLWCTGPKSLAPGESSLGGKGLGVKQKHTCSVAVYSHRLLISTTAHVNGHTLVRLLCTATETPNINYSSCEQCIEPVVLSIVFTVQGRLIHFKRTP